jgi:thioredoxin-like negative regulator of GroEL
MKSFKTINSVEEAEEIISKNIAVLFYFSTTSCSVGEALQPKVAVLINNNFPKIKLINIDLNFSPKTAAHFNAFIEPTILVFFDGKEYIRKSRNVSIFNLEETIERLYKLIF